MITEDSPLYRIRHSLAHVLAQAVKDRFPQVKLGFGPPTETGFYYDFDFGDTDVGPDCFNDLEKRMKKIIGQKQVFERSEGDLAYALAQAERMQEPYKTENINNLANKGCQAFSFYKNGTFIDLCEGPHVDNTQALPIDAFKIDRLAGAYWLGSEKNKMLTRFYVLAFETKALLDQFLERRKMAEEFDHKKLGKDLELFHIDDTIGKGLPLWLPYGAAIRDEIEKFAKEMEFQAGYQRVNTPHITKDALYYRSQHLPAYEDSMFPPMVCKHQDTGHEERYYLKPMNCPHHHMIYAHRPRSYRELPLRLAEYGTCYRFEQSGELSGLLRVRCLTMNDAHIYARMDQVHQEIRDTLQLYQKFYNTFHLRDYSFRLSVVDPDNKDKFKGDAAMWAQAEKILEQVLEELKIPYYVGKGEAAFYGPKIDIQFKNLMGREETVSTIQVDLLSPKNFDLQYVDDQGQTVRPVIIHRAPLSTHERFISFLIEYYGGAFPTWCAPVQVCVIPINDECLPYCQTIVQTLHQHFVRAELDSSNHSFSKKIRINSMRKIPHLLIIGKDEVERGLVTDKRYGIKEQQSFSLSDFVTQLLEDIRTRHYERETFRSII